MQTLITMNLQSSKSISNHATNWPQDAKAYRQTLIDFFNSEAGLVS